MASYKKILKRDIFAYLGDRIRKAELERGGHGEEKERGGERENILHLLIHFPKGHDLYNQVRLTQKPGASS